MITYILGVCTVKKPAHLVRVGEMVIGREPRSRYLDDGSLEWYEVPRRSVCLSTSTDKHGVRLYLKTIGGCSDGVTYAPAECLDIEVKVPYEPPTDLVGWLKRQFATHS